MSIKLTIKTVMTFKDRKDYIVYKKMMEWHNSIVDFDELEEKGEFNTVENRVRTHYELKGLKNGEDSN